MQTCDDIEPKALEDLLGQFGLQLCRVAAEQPIPGSYWGPPEAGLEGLRVWVRGDTPIHSLLHEAGHSICMDARRRQHLHTDAGGEDAEENGVCYLQILLADHLPGVGRQRLMRDMDAWGYSFRLGSTAAWFRDDAEDALRWLQQADLVDADGHIRWHLRR